ncbi:phosphoglycerate mutase-like protein [Lophiostoma macrostomum CBS 122681]|uniref:Phosphoglycerate mutase-like protein n=1 Tax=Lophiostoma macrostomum CBS 122681 TaxID=1314788 RepID=A0A6A6SN44_9PLEO|nr:phosphoglycerate mutase-like protein [Lophiostoma macrostomum CBS 122681]
MTSFHYRYTTIKGYFLQSEAGTDDQKFDFKKQNFGLADRKYETDRPEDQGAESQWQKFARYVRYLDSKSSKDVHYKVLFLGRHGQGWHNVAESKYGTAAWDSHWSKLDGADGITWADAELTDLGKGQAKEASELWKSLLPKGIPAPETYYVSPLKRAIETADLTFKTLDLPDGKPYAPIGKELLRECLGVHTCDRRSPAATIHSLFPHVELESGFSEEDRLWDPKNRELSSERKLRLSQLLDDLFAHDENVFLSLTAHSGAISSILEVIGHRKFALETGGVIPVFVKAEKVAGNREAAS